MTLFHDSGWYRPNEYNDGATYQNAQFPKPRQFQETAHDQLRSGAKSGHRCQMLMAPTGAGKTFLGLRACAEALQKGRRAIFVCDRNTLINQTSERADEYGLAAHGVFQADHWRSNPAMPFQIASAQTLARREWPAADLIVVDEAHTQLKAWTEHIQNTNAHVIGLSATPFSRGLGKLFSNLINAATMRELTDTGILVPMRPFVCSRADMRDAETKGGEWTEKAAQDRGMEIIGDVVSEWFEHANDRKTIVFGPTIAYCEELSARFNAIEPGIAAVFTSYTTPPQRKALLEEYRNPDSPLQILISVEALAKGFDVPSVSCVVDCRPLRKSLSTAIQMWGRGLRCSPDTGKTDCLLLDHCIATGQRVLTHRGPVRIEEILLTDRIWDGHGFVAHKGVVSRGIRSVITYAGLTATADHPVKTAQGWRTLGQCSDEQTPVITTGVGRTALRERDGHFTGPAVVGPARASIRACALRVRHLWLSIRDFAIELARRENEGVPLLQSAAAVSEVALCQSELDASAVQEPEGPQIQGLRRARDRVPFRLRDHLRSLGQGEPWYTARSGDSGTGSDRQQRALRAGEHSLVNAGGEHEQHPSKQVESVDAQIPPAASRGSLRRRIAALVFGRWHEFRRDRGAVEHAIPQAEREVWDILDCGPRNSFTCEGLLVHNSGNILRFAQDYSEIFENGLDCLDAGKKLDMVIRDEKDEEKGDKKCPLCGAIPFVGKCMACGFIAVQKSLIEAIPGRMKEITLGPSKTGFTRRQIYEQACAYARAHSAPEKQSGRAAHIYKDIVGDWPPNQWRFDETPSAAISREVHNKITSRAIAFSKARRYA